MQTDEQIRQETTALKAMIASVMNTLGIHHAPDGGYSVNAEPECFECDTFEDALHLALERERRTTYEEMAHGIRSYLLGVETTCSQARSSGVEVTQ